MFGLIIGWLRNHLGIRTDTASATGSLHAKVAELRAYLVTVIATLSGSTGKIPRLTGIHDTSESYNGYFTIANVTGNSGWITGVYAAPPIPYECVYFLRIIVDGVTLFDGHTGAIPFAWASGSTNFIQSPGSLALHHRFNSSFSVSVWATGPYATGYVSYITDN